MTDTGARNLQRAILTLAISDFKAAIRKERESSGISTARISLQRFFLSDWGELLSNEHGKYIVAKCFKTADENMFPRRSGRKLPYEKEIMCNKAH